MYSSLVLFEEGSGNVSYFPTITSLRYPMSCRSCSSVLMLSASGTGLGRNGGAAPKVARLPVCVSSEAEEFFWIVCSEVYVSSGKL